MFTLIIAYIIISYVFNIICYSLMFITLSHLVRNNEIDKWGPVLDWLEQHYYVEPMSGDIRYNSRATKEQILSRMLTSYVVRVIFSPITFLVGNGFYLAWYLHDNIVKKALQGPQAKVDNKELLEMLEKVQKENEELRRKTV